MVPKYFKTFSETDFWKFLKQAYFYIEGQIGKHGLKEWSPPAPWRPQHMQAAGDQAALTWMQARGPSPTSAAPPRGPRGYFHWTPSEQAIPTVERKNNFSKVGGHESVTQVNGHRRMVNLALAARKEATCRQASWLCQNVLFHHSEI